MKQKNICRNNIAPSLNKELSKVIMTPLRIKTIYLKWSSRDNFSQTKKIKNLFKSKKKLP